MIEEIALEPKQTFWIMTLNLLLDAAAIDWCKVFGSWDEHTHWTNVIPNERHEEVRADLLREALNNAQFAQPGESGCA
ncbi:MAG: hypothetical protein LC130_23845 [Bryobacterales bacterium]|nr:hypothetical protein [Bryobacterales bacterium]